MFIQVPLTIIKKSFHKFPLVFLVLGIFGLLNACVLTGSLPLGLHLDGLSAHLQEADTRTAMEAVVVGHEVADDGAWGTGAQHATPYQPKVLGPLDEEVVRSQGLSAVERLCTVVEGDGPCWWCAAFTPLQPRRARHINLQP